MKQKRAWENGFRLQQAVVLLLSLLIAACAFVFNRRHGTAAAAGCALGCFAVSCAAGLYGLRETVPASAKRRKCMTTAAAVLALLWLLAGLNNSSVSVWREILSGEDPVALWGNGRIIRGDEWAVWTPMLFSQAAQGYPAVNTAIAASATDPTMIAIGGLPAWNLAAVFKPFYWGFLLLGTETGFSLMTLLRLAGLFSVSYLCALEYTKRDRSLSVLAAFLLTLSPYVQWWFSQSICEILIFSQAVILCWIRAARAERLRERLVCGCAAAWCFGCFLMVAYPAWLVPVAYLMLAVLVMLAIRSRKTFKVKQVLQTLAPLVVTAALLFLILRGSWDTLMRVRDSVYPGARVYTGGDRPLNLFTGFFSLTFPVRQPDGAAGNACELANFLSFAPAGILLTIRRRIRTGKTDGLSVLLLVFIAVFGLFALIPLPEWLAKITLLAQCSRPAMIVGLCNLLLLIRALTLEEESRPAGKTSLLLAAGSAVLVTGVTWFAIRPAVYYVPVLAAAAFGIFLLLLSGARRRFVAVVLCLVSVAAGAFVNPVQKGFSEIESLAPVSLVQSAGLDAQTDVLAVEAEWPAPEALLFTGMKVLNSTQPYADPERWRPADPEGRWTDVYNRLCHVTLKIGEETGFQIRAADHIEACLTREDLKKLEVTVLLTQEDYPDLTMISTDGTWNLYRLADNLTGETEDT